MLRTYWLAYYSNIMSKPSSCLRIVHQGHQNFTLNNSSFSMFNGVTDRYNGITVDTAIEPCDKSTIMSKLEESLKKWKEEDRRCIWFKVQINDAHLVPILADKGFNFHHAREKYVTMYKWLPVDSTPNLPPSCYTNLGVGALVFNDKSQLLAISEKHYEYPHWKLPGGYVEKGEDIVDAGIREVREETGIECSFESMITLRHTHNMMFGNGDIYILLMMKAITEKITISQREINHCQWMDIEEYTNHPHVHVWNRKVVQTALEYKKKNIKLDLHKVTIKWANYTREMSYLELKENNNS